MRTGIDAGTLALLATGEYDEHWLYQVANGDGTLIDVSERVSAYSLALPNPSAPVSSLSMTVVRELLGPTDSIVPFMESSLLNRLDDGVTYSPLLEIGRVVVASIAVTARGGARPADASFYELFRGRVAAVSWPGQYGDAVVRCLDQAGTMQKERLEAATSYPAGTSVEDAMQQVLDTRYGAGAYTLSVPVATGVVLESRYEPSKQKPVFTVLWELAQSIGWVVWWRYNAAGVAELTLFEPNRNKSIPDFTFPVIRDVTQLDIDQEELANVLHGEYSNSGGVRTAAGPVEDAVSIAKYGGVRRAAWISEAPDSPVRTNADMLTILAAALSDMADPDAIATVQVPTFPFGECAVDLYTFSADGIHYDSDQLLAPYSITLSGQARALPATTIAVRGRPSAGYRTWAGRRHEGETPDEAYAISNVHEDTAVSTADELAVTGEAGGGVLEIWRGYVVVDRESEEGWAAAAAGIAYFADDFASPLMIPRPGEGQIVLLQLEGRYLNAATGELVTGPVHRSTWGAGAIREGRIEAAAGEVGSTATLFWHEQTAGVAVTAREVYYRIGRSGARLGPFDPAREVGGASSVKARTLAAGEYEWDGSIPTSGFLVVELDITWATGRKQTEVVMPYDRGLNPNFLFDPRVSGLDVELAADPDTRSLRLIGPSGSGYDVAVDGTSKTWTVPVPALTAWWLQARAYRLPALQQASATASDYDERMVYVNNGAASAAAEWDEDETVAQAPVGTDLVRLTLLATAAPVGHTAHLRESHNAGTGWTAYVDITASLSPALSAPPTVATDYTWSSGYAVRFPPPGDEALYRLVEFAFQAEIRDGSSNVIDSYEFYVSYYSTL